MQISGRIYCLLFFFSIDRLCINHIYTFAVWFMFMQLSGQLFGLILLYSGKKPIYNCSMQSRVSVGVPTLNLNHVLQGLFGSDASNKVFFIFKVRT